MNNNAENTNREKLLSLPEAAAKLHWDWKELEETFQCRCNCDKSDLEYLGDRTVTEIRCRNCGKKIVKVPQHNTETDECGWDKVFVTVKPENK